MVRTLPTYEFLPQATNARTAGRRYLKIGRNLAERMRGSRFCFGWRIFLAVRVKGALQPARLRPGDDYPDANSME